jgi:glycerol kinase
MQCLGLDIGSSSIKGAVLDLDRQRVSSVVREPFPAPVSGLPSRYFEVDPDLVTAAVRQVVSRLIEIAPDAKAIFFCGQMGGAILVDHQGKAVTNYLSWRDQRTLAEYPGGGSYLDEIQRRGCKKISNCHNLPSLPRLVTMSSANCAESRLGWSRLRRSAC